MYKFPRSIMPNFLFFLAKSGLSNNIGGPRYLYYISWPLKMLQQGINQAIFSRANKD